MTCPRCRNQTIALVTSQVEPGHLRAASPDASDPAPDIEPPECAPARNPVTSRVFVAAAIASLLLVAAAWTSIAVWSRYRQIAELNEARVAESPINPANAQPLADSIEPMHTHNPDSQPDPNAPPPVSGATEEDETPDEKTPAAPPLVKPEPEKPKPAVPRAGKLIVKRRNDLSEEELRKQLLWAPAISMTPADIPLVAEAFLANVAAAKSDRRDLSMEPTYITSRLAEFKTLPYRRGMTHFIEGKAVRELQVLGRELHAILDRLAPKEGEGRTSADLLGQFMKAETRRDNKPTWLRPDAVPTLQQVLGHEDLPVRLLLVDLLTRIDGRTAGLALVQHAVFDLAPEVREAAIKGLDSRPREQYRSALVAALRYPWAPAADHAAEALVALNDRDAAPLLVKLLKEPDPAAPVAKKDHLCKHEVVRINHSDNCLACHPPAWLGNDPVQRVVAGFTVVGNSTVIPTASLPIASQTIIESGGTVKSQSIRPANRDGGYPHGPKTTTTNATALTVRGDITYLRQDFSIQLPVSLQAAGQSVPLRFDYLVRLRPLTEKQVHEWKKQATGTTDYQQREAVLFALRELTGQDPGPLTEAWEKLYPQSETESFTAELITALVGAPDFQKTAVIKKMRDAKGGEYTDALARAMPQLDRGLQDRARAALLERMKRMNQATLRDKLADENREIRLAAASAVGAKEETALIQDLALLLYDADPAVADAAQASLKLLRGGEGD